MKENSPCREERGFDFTIRTPCTPFRWDEFEAEMEMAVEVCYFSLDNQF